VFSVFVHNLYYLGSTNHPNPAMSGKQGVIHV